MDNAIAEIDRSVDRSPGESRASAMGRLWPIAAAAIVVVFLMLFYAESRYRSCIARAEVRYPAVPVSAVNGETTGPLKVSFAAERARALEECGRL